MAGVKDTAGALPGSFWRLAAGKGLTWPRWVERATGIEPA
jgi:hypothetical protein